MGLVTAAAGAVVVTAAAGGVTSIASGAPASVTAITPVVFGAPLPAAPAPDLQAPLTQTLTALAGAGSFSGAKGQYVQGGLGRIDSRLADSAFTNAASKGYFPLSFNITDIDDNGAGTATANVVATAANGASANQPMTFVAGPSPTGWQVSRASAMALLSSVS
jgi:hypothetical protein